MQKFYIFSSHQGKCNFYFLLSYSQFSNNCHKQVGTVYQLEREAVEKKSSTKFKFGLLPSKKNLFYLLQWKPFKIYEKCFFISSLKLLSFSQYLNSLIKKTRLIFKSLWCHNLVNKHVLPNTSQSKGNQTMEFGQIIEYNKRNIFLHNI